MDSSPFINCIDGEVHGTTGNRAPIHVIVYWPETEEGRHELSVRTAEVHADMVSRYISEMDCSSDQKMQMLDKIMDMALKRKKETEK